MWHQHINSVKETSHRRNMSYYDLQELGVIRAIATSNDDSDGDELYFDEYQRDQQKP